MNVTVLRTPEDRFANLPAYVFQAHYAEIDGLRMHYVDQGPSNAPAVLMLHGEPSWSYLYRKMIPILANAGYRAVAPDLFGFGKSDKPANREDYSYQFHLDSVTALLDRLDARDLTLFAQDWGGLLGLRIAAEQPDRFARIIASNTGLPTGDTPMGPAFDQWKTFALSVPELPIGRIIQGGCKTQLAPDVVAAYDAPFPDETYKAGARAFPVLVPATPDDPAAPANRAAWIKLRQWTKPFLTAFSDGDPITQGGERILQTTIPGAHGQAHVTVAGAGHFLQEDKGEELANVIIEFMERTQ